MCFSYGVSLPEILPDWEPVVQKITSTGGHTDISISYGLFGFNAELQFYDIRHQKDF